MVRCHIHLQHTIRGVGTVNDPFLKISTVVHLGCGQCNGSAMKIGFAKTCGSGGLGIVAIVCGGKGNLSTILGIGLNR